LIKGGIWLKRVARRSLPKRPPLNQRALNSRAKLDSALAQTRVELRSAPTDEVRLQLEQEEDLLSSASAVRLRSRSRRRRTASTTPCMRRRPRSRKASCPEAASRCCAPKRRSAKMCRLLDCYVCSRSVCSTSLVHWLDALRSTSPRAQRLASSAQSLARMPSRACRSARTDRSGRQPTSVARSYNRANRSGAARR
jgi:hypothetical protein